MRLPITLLFWTGLLVPSFAVAQPSRVCNRRYQGTAFPMIVGGDATHGRAVLAYVPISADAVSTLVDGGSTGWLFPSPPVQMRVHSEALGPLALTIDRIAVTSDARGWMHARVVLVGTVNDELDAFGRLTGGCESTAGGVVRRVARARPGSLCAEVLSL